MVCSFLANACWISRTFLAIAVSFYSRVPRNSIGENVRYLPILTAYWSRYQLCSEVGLHSRSQHVLEIKDKMCGASKHCYVESPFMWKWRRRARADAAQWSER